MERLKLPSRPRTRSRSRSKSADAERRLRVFLRGFGIESDAAMTDLVRRLGRMAPASGGTTIDEAAGRWFAALLGRPETDAAKALAAGRVAWLAADAATRWPLALFGEVPPVLIEAIRRAAPALPPAILGDAMPAAPLEPPRLSALVPATARLRTRAA